MISLKEYSNLRILKAPRKDSAMAYFFIRCLCKGGFSYPYNKFRKAFDSGEYGAPDAARLKLVKKLHRSVARKLEGGCAISGIENDLEALFNLFRFADENDFSISAGSMGVVIQKWTDYLYAEVVKGEFCSYRTGRVISIAIALFPKDLIDPLQLKKLAGLSRFDSSRKKKRKSSVNEGLVLDYCSDLLALIEGLTIDRMLQEIPIYIYFGSYGFWAGLGLQLKTPFEPVKTPSKRHLRASVSREMLLYKRYYLVNLRFQAELSYFIAQTGMNLTQAVSLTTGDYRFQTWKGGYEVRKYKGRRRGEVLFTVHSEYMPHFKRYLEFRKEINLDLSRDELFPTNVRLANSAIEGKHLLSLQTALTRIHRVYVPPTELRKSKSNWLLNRGVPRQLVADVMQHTVETLEQNYAEPNILTARREWSGFFSLLENVDPALAPGSCIKIPGKIESSHNTSLVPDCRNVAACFFCTSYSGVVSLDYAWALLSYRYLKIIESVNLKNIASLPAVQQQYDSLIARIDEIISAFSKLNETSKGYMELARQRILEENYHLRWRLHIILSLGEIE